MRVRIKIPVGWMQGHLRYGHLEGELEVSSQEQLNKLLSDEALMDYLDVVVDDYEVEDYGDLYKPEVTVLEE